DFVGIGLPLSLGIPDTSNGTVAFKDRSLASAGPNSGEDLFSNPRIFGKHRGFFHTRYTDGESVIPVADADTAFDTGRLLGPLTGPEDRWHTALGGDGLGQSPLRTLGDQVQRVIQVGLATSIGTDDNGTSSH